MQLSHRACGLHGLQRQLVLIHELVQVLHLLVECDLAVLLDHRWLLLLHLSKLV